MAEINVERKKNVWPWIVGLMVLLLAIWGAMALMGNDGRRTHDDRAIGSAATAPAATQQPAPANTPAIAPADTTATGDAAAVTGDAATTRDEAATTTDERTPPRR